MHETAFLKRALSLLSHRWVRDFFFKSSESELDELKYALSSSQQHTVDYYAASLPAPGPLAYPTILEKERSLILPTFSTSDQTACIIVTETIASSDPKPNSHYLGRILRDDASGAVLCIVEDVESDFVEVSYCQQVSNGHREEICCMFVASRFRAAVSASYAPLDFSAINRALVSSYTATSAMRCRACSSDTMCACPLGLVRKRHWQDKEAELTNMRSYAGRYRGKCSLQLFSGGLSMMTTTHDVIETLTVRQDWQSQRQLGRWALALAAERQICRLQRLAMPVIHTAEGASERKPNSEDHPGSDVEAEGAFDLFNVLRKTTANALDISHFQNEASWSLRSQRKYNKPTIVSDAKISNRSQKLVPGEVASPERTPVVIQRLVEAHDVQKQTQCSGSSKSELLRETANPHYPVLPVLLPAPMTKDNSRKRTLALDVTRIRKIEMRRIRNREAAQRSNERKRQKFARLRDAVSTAKTYQLQLSAREKVLQEENSWLKDSLER